jgi:hypothetical protein
LQFSFSCLRIRMASKIACGSNRAKRIQTMAPAGPAEIKNRHGLVGNHYPQLKLRHSAYEGARKRQARSPAGMIPLKQKSAHPKTVLNLLLTSLAPWQHGPWYFPPKSV